MFSILKKKCLKRRNTKKEVFNKDGQQRRSQRISSLCWLRRARHRRHSEFRPFHVLHDPSRMFRGQNGRHKQRDKKRFGFFFCCCGAQPVTLFFMDWFHFMNFFHLVEEIIGAWSGPSRAGLMGGRGSARFWNMAIQTCTAPLKGLKKILRATFQVKYKREDKSSEGWGANFPLSSSAEATKHLHFWLTSLPLYTSSFFTLLNYSRSDTKGPTSNIYLKKKKKTIVILSWILSNCEKKRCRCLGYVLKC